MQLNVRIDGVEKILNVEKKADGYHVAIDGKDYLVEAEALSSGTFTFFVGKRSLVAHLTDDGDVSHLAIGGRNFRVEKDTDDGRRGGAGTAAHADGKVVSPMPGNIIKVCVDEGERVEAHQAVVVIESMKMQNEIQAPVGGEIAKVSCSVGDQVGFGDVLVEITPSE